MRRKFSETQVQSGSVLPQLKMDGYDRDQGSDNGKLDGHITPLVMFEGRAEAIQAERQRKLIAAREARKQQRKIS